MKYYVRDPKGNHIILNLTVEVVARALSIPSTGEHNLDPISGPSLALTKS